MARNLMKKNWKVMVYDINKDAVQVAVQDGKQMKLNHMDCSENEIAFTITTASQQSVCFPDLYFMHAGNEVESLNICLVKPRHCFSEISEIFTDQM